MTLLKFCHVMQTDMNSLYHSNEIITCSLKATWLFKLRLYLQTNFRLYLNQLLHNNHKVAVCFIYHTYAQIKREKHLLIHSQKQKVKLARVKWCQGCHHEVAERTEAESNQSLKMNCFFLKHESHSNNQGSRRCIPEY